MVYLKTEKIQKYHIHNSLDRGMMTTNMFEPMKGIFKNVAPDKLSDWSYKGRQLNPETLKRTKLDLNRHVSQFFQTTNSL